MRLVIIIVFHLMTIRTGLFLTQSTLPTGAEESTTLRIATLLNKFGTLFGGSLVALIHKISDPNV